MAIICAARARRADARLLAHPFGSLRSSGQECAIESNLTRRPCQLGSQVTLRERHGQWHEASMRRASEQPRVPRLGFVEQITFVYR